MFQRFKAPAKLVEFLESHDRSTNVPNLFHKFGGRSSPVGRLSLVPPSMGRASKCAAEKHADQDAEAVVIECDTKGHSASNANCDSRSIIHKWPPFGFKSRSDKVFPQTGKGAARGELRLGEGPERFCGRIAPALLGRPGNAEASNGGADAAETGGWDQKGRIASRTCWP